MKYPLQNIGLSLVILLAWLGALNTPVLDAQYRDPGLYDYPQNHLPWFTIESDHFLVHFQQGNSRPAQVISRIAEEIYPSVTSLYQYEPDSKISIVLNDRLDYSNGAAYFLDNKIEIWLPALDSPLRGTHDWLRNVITHEFVHIVQIQKSLKYSRKRPVTYVQWLSYEDVRRPDVLYGYPSGVVTYPFSGVSVPAWLAEGTAQYQTADLYYDYWDSHRDMILRTRILEGSWLDLNRMGTFASKTSIEREVTYNQGFAFTNYLADRFGEDIVRDISTSFSHRGVFDVRDALEKATGTPGEVVFESWVKSLKEHYNNQMAGRSITQATWLEPEGFFNFYPVYVPATGEILYLSNRGREDARVELYSLNQQSHGISVRSLNLHETGLSTSNVFIHSCGVPHKSEIRFIQSAFSVSNDGRKILYNRIRETRHGETYNDLHLFDRDSEKNHRLSFGMRLTEPSFSADDSRIVAVLQRDGTMNLVILESEKIMGSPPISDDRFKVLTGYSNGEQLFRPVWHPDQQSIFVSFANGHRRQIHWIDATSGEIQKVLHSEQADFRDPHMSSDGQWLYFSSDLDGIFNIYRVRLDELQSKSPSTDLSESVTFHRLTSVQGGAFMPVTNSEDELIYAEYVAQGYKIAQLKTNSFDDSTIRWNFTKGIIEQSTVREYQRAYHPANTLRDMKKSQQLNTFDDSDILSLPDSLFTSRRAPEKSFEIATVNGSDHRTVAPYQDTFTSFTIYPAIRFDNYSKLNGSNSSLLVKGRIGDLGENLWRDVKPGLYFASRDMIDRFSVFGGIMVGLGSIPTDGIGDFVQPARLVDLDRDMFLMAEYRGLPFIKRSWSPTVSIELFNLRRNVKDGLSIEEFPCTACLPDTTSIGIAYDIWEAQISLISKLNRFTVLELGWHHSPYRVSTNQFFSREYRQTIPGSSSRYFIGNTFTAAIFSRIHTYHRHADIVPLGLDTGIRYRFQPSQLLDGYDIRGGVLIPLYNSYSLHSLELDSRYGFRALNDRLFDIRSRFYSNFSASNEYFFLDYIGGLVGMRSYSFFALGGNTTLFAQLNYHQPIFEQIHKQIGRFTVDKLFARVFLEAGNGWGGPLEVGNDIKSGIGAELRLSMNSYYLFPSRLFVSGAWGFNRFEVTLPESFITTTGQNSVTYGREVLINFGLLFDFNF